MTILANCQTTPRHRIVTIISRRPSFICVKSLNYREHWRCIVEKANIWRAESLNIWLWLDDAKPCAGANALRRTEKLSFMASPFEISSKRLPLQYSKLILDQVDAEAPLGCCGGESAEDTCVGWIRSATVGNNPACSSAWCPSDNHRDPDTRRLAIGCERATRRE